MTTENRELLFRLIKKGVVVGYEYWREGLTYHVKEYYNFMWRGDVKPTAYANYYDDIIDDYEKYFNSVYYIKHDRKDQFTGVTLKDGTKVFERDKLVCHSEHMPEDIIGTVVWCQKRLAWCIDDNIIGYRHLASLITIQEVLPDTTIKITGISGVAK